MHFAVSLWLWFHCGIARCDEHQPVSDAQAQNWIDGLNGSNYKTRREAFLKLCDRSFDIDDWLARETATGDPHRASVARWLIRLRKSQGTPAERVALLHDFEALRDSDWSILERYASEGKWDSVLDLLSLLEPQLLRALLSETDFETMIARAWETDQELVVPKLLNFVIDPPQRAYVNRWWRTLNLNEEWHVDEQSNLPSVQIAKLESEGKIDEAIELAKKKGILNQVERLLIRANRWDTWLNLDTRRIPVSGSINLHQQRAGLLITLGQMEEAEQILDQAKQKKETDRKRGIIKLDAADAVLANALGNEEAFDRYLATLPGFTEFSIRRSCQQPKKALAAVGLNDISPKSVDSWLDEEQYKSFRPSIDSEPDLSEKLDVLKLVQVADFFFQLGLNAQGEKVQQRLASDLIEREPTEGFAAWAPTLFQMYRLNDRPKAVRLWAEFLIRNHRPASNARTQELAPYELEKLDPFQVLYPDFPVAAQALFESLKMESHLDQQETDHETIKLAYEKIVEQLEDMYAGRLPKGWASERKIVPLVQSALLRTQTKAETNYRLTFELAEILDSLGDTDLALQTLNINPFGKQVIQAKAKYLDKLGESDAAASLLLTEFKQNTTDVELFLQCADQLERAGRFSDLDRVRAQAFSSVENKRRDMADQSILFAPVRREVQVLLEQIWLREDSPQIGRSLFTQYSEAAKKESRFVKKAAEFARIEAIEWIKSEWSNNKGNFARLQIGFIRCFESFILDAIEAKDIALADTLFRVAYRGRPTDIELPILFVPKAEKLLGKEVADRWFDLFYLPMLEHLKEFPDDHLVGNNTAWLAVSCNRNLETAKKLAEKVTNSEPSSTYLDTLAEVEYRLGNVERAIELSERCRALEPKSQHHRDQLKRFRANLP